MPATDPKSSTTSYGPFQHPQLGQVIGLDGDVVSFRGIQYGVLENRFSDAILKDHHEQPLNAENVGPVFPMPPGAFQLEMTLMQQSLPEPQRTSSDLNALNLNIWVPKLTDGQLPKPGSLPVFVWIHGGGFVSGSSSWPQYDLTRLVRLSAEHNTPIIGVTINFRLGMLGYLTSAELRSAGCSSNNQLRDQRLAFEWLHKNIAGFGGDVDEITVAGESTGGVDVGLHLLADEPLFARALMTGGSPLLMKVFGAEQQEWVYGQVIETLGLKPKTVAERVHALLTIPIDDIVAKLSQALPFRPMLDDDIVPRAVTFSMVSDEDSTAIAGRRWLKGLMIGDCQFDASSLAIFLAHKKEGVAQKFPDFLRHALADDPATVTSLLEAYGFLSTSLDDQVGFRAMLNFANDIGYFASTYSFARGWKPKCYAFLVNESNPWEGLFQGEATHIMDVILLFQNFKDKLPPAQASSGIQLALDLFTFMRGGSPWPSSDEALNTAKVYGPSSHDANTTEPSVKVVNDMTSKESGRRRAMIDAGTKIGFDNIANAFEGFLAS